MSSPFQKRVQAIYRDRIAKTPLARAEAAVLDAAIKRYKRILRCHTSPMLSYTELQELSRITSKFFPEVY